MQPPARAPSRSLIGLVGRTCTDLAQALLVGLLVVVPVQLVTGEQARTDVYTFYDRPPDDAALLDWLKQQPEYRDVRLRVDGGRLVLEYWARSLLAGRAPVPPLGELGYSVHTAQNRASFLPDLDAGFFLVTLLAAQGGFAFVVWRRRRVQRQAAASLLGPSGSFRRHLALGVAVGLGLLALGLGHDSLLRAVEGSDAATAGAWEALRQAPRWLQLAVLALGVLLAPVCEELFFRAHLLERFRQAGRPGWGIAVTSLLFASLHFAPAAPLAFAITAVTYVAFGVVLALTWLGTRSLVASSVAHALNNLVALSLLLA